ncbi:transposase [Alkalihalobacillus xiaoxiensis]|uniref:Transposase n=1 Tax=Shouchella xiaoxiensis TaxID=766895 RepID=A0ABS2SUE3_9BACI|nr:transposase [Shouchella xiaoxiensis]
MTKRKRRTFSEDFKKQMVQLYQSGKPRSEIIREYDLTSSTLDKWVKQKSRDLWPEKNKSRTRKEELDGFTSSY